MDRTTITKIIYYVDTITCMQLFSDKIEFEPDDFKFELNTILYTRGGPGKFHDYWVSDPSNGFWPYAEQRAGEYTTAVNRRLSYLSKGLKGKDTPYRAIRVFEYLWKQGVPHKKDCVDFGWVPRSEILKNLVQYRRVGRPKTKKSNVRCHVINDECPIPNEGEMGRILLRMKDAGLIREGRETINKESISENRRYYTFYRISPDIIDSPLYIDDKIKQLEKENKGLFNAWNLMMTYYRAAKEIMKKNGIEYPDEEITNLLKPMSFPSPPPSVSPSDIP